MIGNTSIDLSLKNIWDCYRLFRHGKKVTGELDYFQFNLESNLDQLYLDLHNNRYRHGRYRKFTVIDNKRREIAVTNIRDRVVHRLLYEYLYPIFDPTFIYDVWSCRQGKGLIGAIKRAQHFLRRYSDCCVWRADIQKFFDHVDHRVLFNLITRQVTDNRAISILQEVISSYHIGTKSERERE